MKASVARDTEGYLIDADDWNEVVASELAHEEGISLNDEYWRVLNFIRSYYDQHGITPDIRHLVKQLASERGIDKKQAKQYLFTLFPYGYVKQTCKIAGMKRPRAWSTG
jgi:TusE/DsrC/DsvC family sulfur relay protein